MGRRPEVFVRQVSMAEGQRLQKITRTAKDPVKLPRAIVVLMSAQGQPAPNIAHLLTMTEDYVRDVIHAFNDRGFDAWICGHQVSMVVASRWSPVTSGAYEEDPSASNWKLRSYAACAIS